MKGKCKIVFLDIDGVINKFKTDSDMNIITRLDDDAISNLNDIISNTGAKIVISSTWKVSPSLMDMLEEELFPKLPTGCVIGCTPTIFPQTVREEEIRKWLLTNFYVTESYVILDDYDFELKGFIDEGRCVITDAINGLTHDDAVRAIAILNKPLENASLTLSNENHDIVGL